MNVKDRYRAKQEAKEEAYYKGMEAPQTKMVDTGNGFTQAQTNTDKNEPVNAPVQNNQNKQTTLQNYKPVEQAQPKEEAPVQEAQAPQAQVQPEAQAEVKPEANAEAGADSEPDADVTGQVGEVDEGMMDKVGINPKNTEEENKKNTENVINKITGNRNKDGTYKPLGKWEYADGIQQFGILATIASIGLAVLTRGAFPPVDFSMFTGLNESYANYVKGINNYNDYIRQAQSENAYESERAKGSEDDANKAAQLNAAGEEKNYIAGICTNFTSKGYDYWVAVEVEPDMERPEGFEMTETPEGSYAYFECEGGSEEAIAKKWEEVYNKWFPKSGYNHKGTQEIEVYPAGDMEAEGYRCTLLVPVRPLEKIPLSKYRRNSLGSAPFILLGSVVGLLIAGNKATDTKRH